MIEFLEFKKALQSLQIPKEDANQLIEEINEDLRKSVKKWLKRDGIETDH